MSDMVDGPVYAFTWFARAFDAADGRRISLTAPELRHQLATAAPWGGAKGDLPLVSTAVFRSNHRKNVNVESVGVLGLDIDFPQADPAARIQQISDALGGVEVFGCSTFSSSPGAFKLRAFVPYDQPANGDQHRASWRLVAYVLAEHGVVVDRACSDPARGFYVWAIPSNGAYWHGHVDGRAWPVSFAAEKALEAQKAETEARASRRREVSPSDINAYERARTYVAKMPAAIAGSHGHDATFNVARKVVQDFGLNEFEARSILFEYNARCSPPWSDRELEHKLQSALNARVCNPVEAR